MSKLNIVILCGGPPKKNRQRHLELFKGKILINKILDECHIENTSLHVLINKKNLKLIEHVKNYNNKNKNVNVNILIVEDDYSKSTIKKAISVNGDCLLIAGDLIDLKKKDILKFVNSKYEDCLCRYKQSWGNNIIGKNVLRRSDIGDCLLKISEKNKKNYFNDDSWNKAIDTYKLFYPNNEINFKNWNDIPTHLDYLYFQEIWGNIGVNEFKNKGTVYFKKKIYNDND